MLCYKPCTRRAGWALSHHIQRRSAPLRGYASPTNSDDPLWFQQLRAQMLQRGVTHLPEHLTIPHEYKLSQTLTDFLPREYCHPPGLKNPIVPFGHHLIWFNPSLPTCDLLPDGTDASQSPGGPWVRRMWAGGSVKVKPGDYFDKHRGFAVDTPMAGAEHIKHVRLHGQDDTAKIFVTIERRFARVDTLKESYKNHHGSLGRASGLRRIQAHFEEQLRGEDPWGSAVLKEERNLVFFKERSPAELDAIKAGQLAPIKYLDPPGDPLFSHTLIPNRALLFRFSALTFNAHLIHLDPEYARNVEGHRNLLVHGPLSLTLMLQVMKNHLDVHSNGEQVLESIEYRNLAPLYCDEEMRICGKEKKTLQNGCIYDVWIEGPTGGVAVKGTIYTSNQKPASASGSTSTPARTPGSGKSVIKGRTRKSSTRSKASGKDGEEQAASRELDSTSKKTRSIREHVASDPATTPDLSTKSVFDHSAQTEDEELMKPSFSETTSEPSDKGAKALLILPRSQAYRRNRPTRLRSHRFINLSTEVAPPIRTVQSFVPVKPILSPRTKLILHRLLRNASPTRSRKPLPLVRKYAASPYQSDPIKTAMRSSRFSREGVRKIEKPRIKYAGVSLARLRI